MAKIRVWKNVLKTAYFGRTASINELKLPVVLCPAVAPGGRSIAVGPGSEYHDDRGVMDLVMNASSAAFTVLLFGTKEDVQADLAALGHNASERVLSDKHFTVPEIEVKGPDGKKVLHGGVVIRGVAGVFKDVSEDYKAAIDLSGNVLASAKELAALTQAGEEKDATIEALKAEIEKLKKSGAKEEKKQSAVAAAVGSVVSAVSGKG